MRMLSDKAITILAIIASLFLGTFLMVLIVPPLLFGATSPVVRYAGLEIVRFVLFVCSMVSLFGIGPFLIYEFHQKNRLKDATNHFVKNKLQVILLCLDMLDAAHGGNAEQELRRQIRTSIYQLNDAIKETIQTDGRALKPLNGSRSGPNLNPVPLRREQSEKSPVGKSESDIPA
jgi:hypothetical protein